jgi:hypothetical protein
MFLLKNMRNMNKQIGQAFVYAKRNQAWFRLMLFLGT